MKRCPSCRQGYTDDALQYCPADGSQLVNETASSYDAQKTMVAPAPPSPTPTRSGDLPPTQYQNPTAPQQNYQTRATGWSEPPNQPPQAPWPVQPSAQQMPPQGWGAPPSQPSAPWGYNPPPSPNMPYSLQAAQATGQRRGLSITALVFGVLSAYNLFLALTGPYLYYSARWPSLLIALLGIGFSAGALVLTMTNPARYGGKGLAIAGLATSVPAFLYLFLRFLSFRF